MLLMIACICGVVGEAGAADEGGVEGANGLAGGDALPVGDGCPEERDDIVAVGDGNLNHLTC